MRYEGSLHDVKQVRICSICLVSTAKGGRSYVGNGELERTQRMATAQLRLLRVFTLEFVTNAVKQLHVALLRVLLECGDEGPRHGARCLACDLRVLPAQ